MSGVPPVYVHVHERRPRVRADARMPRGVEFEISATQLRRGGMHIVVTIRLVRLAAGDDMDQPKMSTLATFILRQYREAVGVTLQRGNALMVQRAVGDRGGPRAGRGLAPI